MSITDLTSEPGKFVPMQQATEEGPVMALMQQAVEKGLSVESISALVDLQDRVMRRRAELEFSRAFAEFQVKCPSILRNKRASIATKSGGSYGFSYADFEQVVATVRPPLAEAGFSFTFDSESDGKSLKVTCHLRHTNGHSVASSFKLPTDNTSGMSEQQKVGSALSYAKRQALVAVLGAVLTDDQDAPPPAPIDEPITEEQCATIEALAAEVKLTQKFWLHFHCEKFSGLRRSQYGEAVRILEGIRRGAK